MTTLDPAADERPSVISGEKLSVGAPYFNVVAGPLALFLAALVGLGPLLARRRERRPVRVELGPRPGRVQHQHHRQSLIHN